MSQTLECSFKDFFSKWDQIRRISPCSRYLFPCFRLRDYSKLKISLLVEKHKYCCSEAFPVPNFVGFFLIKISPVKFSKLLNRWLTFFCKRAGDTKKHNLYFFPRIRNCFPSFSSLTHKILENTFLGTHSGKSVNTFGSWHFPASHKAD